MEKDTLESVDGQKTKTIIGTSVTGREFNVEEGLSQNSVTKALKYYQKYVKVNNLEVTAMDKNSSAERVENTNTIGIQTNIIHPPKKSF